MMNLPSFEEAYACSRMFLDRYQELLQEFDNDSEDVCPLFKDALESHKQILCSLQKLFYESFPNVKIMLSGALSYNQFSAYWRILLKYPELCKGIEWKIFTAFYEVTREVKHHSKLEAFRKCLPEISSLFSTPLMVDYMWKRVNSSSGLVLPFVRWLSSDLFSAEVGANVGKFYRALLKQAQGQELSENQSLLLEICS